MKYFHGQDQSNCSSKQVNDRFVVEAAPLSPSGTVLILKTREKYLRERYMAYIMDTNEEERVKVHLILKELVRKSLSATQVAVFYFHDQFTWLKGAGLITILFGVSLFNWYKSFNIIFEQKNGLSCGGYSLLLLLVNNFFHLVNCLETAGLVYGKLFGITKHTTKSDIISLLEGCNVNLDDMKVDYNRTYMPTGMMIQFPSQYAYDVAIREINRKARLYKLERADQS
ncbi:putative sugar phosphate/phosphate translocator [Camellia lanceoleosa]|uniref:Sugar phosphate/phosphate translocator n=1 Tax=Camellia lanceoleosa TaxID=1840588 RepID=A0ACC0HWI7_9ERIC|nr:putative sugar phosphate/phosphate translocator [Camellia lanceoleosa]